MIRPPPKSPLFPYTTLFRSQIWEHVSQNRSSHRPRRDEPRDAPTEPACLRYNGRRARSEEHTSELQSHVNLVCRLLLEKKKKKTKPQRCRRTHTYRSQPPFC